MTSAWRRRGGGGGGGVSEKLTKVDIGGGVPYKVDTWVGAQNLKKPADSSDWRQKL